MRLALLTAALWAAFFFAAPAVACEGPELVLSRLQADYPETRVVQRVTGAEARDFVEGFNAVPPVSGYRADEVLVLAEPDHARYRLVQFFRSGCLVGGGLLATPIVERLIGEPDRPA